MSDVLTTPPCVVIVRFPAVCDGGERGGGRSSPGAVPRPGRVHRAGQHQHLAQPLLLAGDVAVATGEDPQT